VRQQILPAYDATLAVAKREPSRLEPPVHAVSPAKAMLHFVRSSGFNGLSKSGDYMREVIRVNGVCGFPMLQFFEALSEVFKDLAAYEFDPALGVHDRQQSGNGVDNQAKGLFACLLGVRSRPVFQVNIRA